MNTTPKCSKCGAEMQQGFVPDQGHDGKRFIPHWVAGTPEEGFFGSPKVRGKEQYSILSFRCTKCGFLDFYARNS
jgi:predicted nucleic-acid-binding Zn-ribbon protein